jgi:hypothetical protein
MLHRRERLWVKRALLFIQQRGCHRSTCYSVVCREARALQQQHEEVFHGERG